MWGYRAGSNSSIGLPSRILELNLTSAWTGLHLVPKAEAVALECGDEAREVGDSQHDTVPSTRLLSLAIRERPGSGRSRTTEEDLGSAQRNARESRKLLMFQLEAKAAGIERDRAGDVLDLIPDAMNTLDESLWLDAHSV